MTFFHAECGHIGNYCFVKEGSEDPTIQRNVDKQVGSWQPQGNKVVR